MVLLLLRLNMNAKGKENMKLVNILLIKIRNIIGKTKLNKFDVKCIKLPGILKPMSDADFANT